MSQLIKKGACVLLASLIWGLSPAVALNNNTTTLDNLIQALKNCEQEESALHRLDCYDKVVKELPESESLAATPVRKKAVTEGEDSPDFLNVTEIWEYKKGYYKFRLVNGEVWRQTEINSSFPIDLERQYYLQEGFFGSFHLRTPGLNTRLRVAKE